MPQFMFVYRGAEHPDLGQPATLEQRQRMMRLWLDYFHAGVEEGWLLDGGGRLERCGALVTADLQVAAADWADPESRVGGYSLVEAVSLAAAVERAKQSPVPKAGGTVEVRELARSEGSS